MIRIVHPGPRIQGSKRHRIPDPEPQHFLNGPDQTGSTSDYFGDVTALVLNIVKAVLRIRIRDSE
jgi:hypothetical protein